MSYERTLIERARSGDRQAAEQTVRRFYPAVLRFLRHLTWNHEEAQDLAQATFVRAAEGLPGFQFQCTFNHWLHRIAYREYLNWLRSRRELLSLDEAAALPSAATCGTGLIVVVGALDDLDNELRDTFLLHEVEELSIHETAEIMGIPAGTVKSRLSRAKEQLRRRLVSLEPAAKPQRWEERNETT